MGPQDGSVEGLTEVVEIPRQTPSLPPQSKEEVKTVVGKIMEVEEGSQETVIARRG